MLHVAAKSDADAGAVRTPELVRRGTVARSTVLLVTHVAAVVVAVAQPRHRLASTVGTLEPVGSACVISCIIENKQHRTVGELLLR